MLRHAAGVCCFSGAPRSSRLRIIDEVTLVGDKLSRTAFLLSSVFILRWRGVGTRIDSPASCYGVYRRGFYHNILNGLACMFYFVPLADVRTRRYTEKLVL